MWMSILFFMSQIFISHSIDNALFATKYFASRRITNVVGFTCNGTEEIKYKTIKTFNDNNQVVGINELTIDRILKLAYLKRSQYRLGIYIDELCADNEFLDLLYNEGNKFYLYSSQYKWLILSNDLTKAVQRLNDTNFSVITDMVIAVPENNAYVLHEVYNVCKYRGGKLNVNKLGTWSNDQFNGMFFDQNFSRRFDYGGIAIRTAGMTVYRPPNVSVSHYLQTYRDVSKDGMTKYSYAVALHWADIFNFTVDVRDYTEWKAGDLVGPVVLGLHSRDIDISGSSTIMTDGPAKYVDYIYHIWPYKSFFLFRTTSSSHVRMGEFLAPFAISCWYIVLFLCVFATVIFGVVLAFEKMHISKIELYTIGLIITTGSLCQQGSAYIPAKAPGRIAFLNTMIFSLLLYNYYSASAVSARLDKPIEKMNDSLVELSKTDMVLAAEPSLFFDFQLNAKDWEISIFRERWYKTPSSERYMQPEEAVKKMYKGGFAYHTTPEAAYPYIARTFDNRPLCELTEVHMGQPGYLYLNTRINSPFTEMARLGSIKMNENGLIKRQLIRWKTRKPECKKDILSAASITIIEIAPLFCLWIIGIILSLITFELEKIVYMISHGKKIKLRRNRNSNLALKASWLKKTFAT